MSVAIDRLKQALESLKAVVDSGTDGVDSAVTDVDNDRDELREALATARSEMRDASTAMRDCIVKVRELCAREVIDETAVTDALDELDSAATWLDSAAGDVTRILGDADEQPAHATAMTLRPESLQVPSSSAFDGSGS
jgi:hypothetical protein